MINQQKILKYGRPFGLFFYCKILFFLIIFFSFSNYCHADWTGNSTNVNTQGRVTIGDTIYPSNFYIKSATSTIDYLNRISSWPILIRNISGSIGSAGVGFTLTNSVNTVSGGILMQRTGSSGKANMRFYVKTDTAENTYPFQAMMIHDDGHVEIATSTAPTGLVVNGNTYIVGDLYVNGVKYSPSSGVPSGQATTSINVGFTKNEPSDILIIQAVIVAIASCWASFIVIIILIAWLWSIIRKLWTH